MKNNIALSISIMLLIISTSLSVNSQNWTGNVNSDWNNNANWSSTPSNGDDILIDPANYTGAMAQPLITGNSNFSPAEMIIQNGGHLSISGNLTTSDRIEVVGEGSILTMTSGAFTLSGGGNNDRLIFAEGGHFQMEGGTLNVGQRLLFELGGTGEVNNGNITVGETIALVDGNANGSSNFIFNNGTITTNAEFAFENEEGVYFPTYQQNGGTLQINGDLFFLGEAPGAGRAYFQANGGQISVSGLIANDLASTMGMQISLNGNAVLNHTGSTVSLLIGDSIIMDQNASWIETNTVLWTNNGVFESKGNSIFQSGQTVLNGTGIYQFHHLTIPITKSLNHIQPTTISVSGDINNAGNFNHNANNLVLNGSSQQTITSPALNLSSLEINNSSNGPTTGGYGVTSSNNISINNQLKMTDGILETTANVIFIDNATISGGSDSSFIDGNIMKTGDDAFTFHVGNTPDLYRPLTISAPTNANTQVQVEYVNATYSVLSPVETPLQTVSAIEYWNMSRTGSSDLFEVSAGWNNASQSGLSNCTDISLTVFDGSLWNFVPSVANGMCNGNAAGSLNSSVPLPAIGPLTIGFTSNVYQNNFELCNGDSITINGNTYSQNGVYIDELTDSQGNDSTIITVLNIQDPLILGTDANGTTLSVDAPLATQFQWLDCNNNFLPITNATNAIFEVSQNGSYAVVVSNGGCADTSECMIVTTVSVDEMDFKSENFVIYPNPSYDGQFFINSDIKNIQITVFDISGKTCPFTFDNASKSFNIAELEKGYYILLIESETGNFTKRIMYQ